MDTPTENQTQTQEDPHATGTGRADAPGGSDATEKSAYDLTYGQEAYAGPREGGETDRHSQPPPDDRSSSRNAALADGPGNLPPPQLGGVYVPPDFEQPYEQPGNETGLNSDTPEAGDVDPDSTRSAEETGQDGDPSERKKSMGHPWNG